MTNAFLFAVCEELTVKRTHVIFLNTGFARCVKREPIFVVLVMKLVSAPLVGAGGPGGVCAGSDPGWSPRTSSKDAAGGCPPARRVSSCNF